MEQLEFENLRIGNVVLKKSGEEVQITSEEQISEMSQSSEDYMGIQLVEQDYINNGFQKMGGDDDYYYLLELNDSEIETSEKSMHFHPLDVDGITVLIHYRHELENLIREIQEG